MNKPIMSSFLLCESQSNNQVLCNSLICRMVAILDLYVNSYFFRQNNPANEFLDLKLVKNRY